MVTPPHRASLSRLSPGDGKKSGAMSSPSLLHLFKQKRFAIAPLFQKFDFGQDFGAT
jgi:hypothetical protein